MFGSTEKKKGERWRRFLKEENGQVTVFLTLLLCVIVPVILITLEIIRYEQAKGRVHHMAVGAVEQIMADYEVEMADWYHIYTLDENYLGRGKEVASNRAWDYLEENLISVDWLGRTEGFYNFIVKDAQIVPTQYLYEEECQSLKKQIHKWTLYTMIPTNKRKKREDIQKQDTEQGEKAPIYDQTTSDQDDREEIDPRGIIEAIKRIGILTVASNPNLPLSKAIIDQKDLPSKQLSWAKKEGTEGEGSILLEKLELETYIFQHFQSALSVVRENETAYSNEMEYLIAGKQSDYDCLEKVARQMVGLRLPLNLYAIHRDGAKKGEAKAAATIIAVLAAQPEAIEGITEGILGAWAYGESIADVKCLLQGEKVPLKKNKSNWKLSFSQLFHMETMVPKQSKDGIGYEDYLKLLLGKVPEKTIYFRMLDLMQLNIQMKYPEFKIQDCVTKYELTTTIQLDTRFFALPVKKGAQYEFIVSHAGGYDG